MFDQVYSVSPAPGAKPIAAFFSMRSAIDLAMKLSDKPSELVTNTPIFMSFSDIDEAQKEIEAAAEEAEEEVRQAFADMLLTFRKTDGIEGEDDECVS